MMNSKRPILPPLYYELNEKLCSLINISPNDAIEEAKNIKSEGNLTSELVNVLKGSTFIGAGSFKNDPVIVEEGIKIFRKLFYKDTRIIEFAYNLANGLYALSKIHNNNEKQWFIKSHEWRKEARRLYHYVGITKSDSSICTQAMTNIGNIFLESQRVLEAYDAYREALQYDPENGIAATGAAKILLHYKNHNIGDTALLTNIAAKLIAQANEHKDKILKYGSSQALDELEDLLSLKLETKEIRKQNNLSDYEHFVAKNRLTLSPTIEGVDSSIDKWDSLLIEFSIEKRDDEFGVPPIYAMFNTLKSEYLAARFLAYKALNTNMLDSGFYSDTLDYANYGLDTSLLILAQRSCVDILDKIAIATSEYFNLSGNRHSINFYNRWYLKKQHIIIDWKDQIKTEIDRGNYALVTLSELSEDVSEDGFLQIKKTLRNSSTHRFVILHEGGVGSVRQSNFIEHYDQDDFNNELVTTLQVVRSALFYFVEMISINEYKKINAENVASVPLVVPSHSWVSGEGKFDLDG